MAGNGSLAETASTPQSLNNNKINPKFKTASLLSVNKNLDPFYVIKKEYYAKWVNTIMTYIIPEFLILLV